MKDNDKDKFTFADEIESDIEDQPAEPAEEPIPDAEQSKFAGVSQKEYSKRTNIVRISILLSVISALVFAVGIIWQDDTTILGICNSFWLVAVLQFFIGWILLINNMQIFAPLTYAVKSFGKLIIGKRMDTDYYTYVKEREDKTIPSYYYKICFIATAITLIPAIILLIIIMQQY